MGVVDVECQGEQAGQAALIRLVRQSAEAARLLNSRSSVMQYDHQSPR
jgi:hypothetical protein